MSIRSVAGYLAMIGGTIAGFLLLDRRGASLVAPPMSDMPFQASADHSVASALLHVLLALLIVMVVARLVAMAFKYIHQPPVVGEVVAGIMLGPSVLGQISPSASVFLLPPAIASQLGMISQIGVILFMFLVGLKLDKALLRSHAHVSVAISHTSIIVPFLMGGCLAIWLYPKVSTQDVPFTYFALFMGVAMSITAFPVLARILADRKMIRTRMGATALACAAVDDATAWCLLAFVVGIASARGGSVWRTLALALIYVTVMLALVRPLVVAWVGRFERAARLSQNAVAVAIGALLLSSLATELIGIHALFGAFLLGALVPHNSLVAREIGSKIEDLVVVFLLPAFFAFSGMRTQVGLMNGLAQWLLCGLIILVACAGKFGGTLVAARVTGLGWRDAVGLGLLMNTRGLMELIVLNIGLDLRIISPTLFAMMVLMALATTLLTSPLLHLLTRSRPELARAGPDLAEPARPLGGTSTTATQVSYD